MVILEKLQFDQIEFVGQCSEAPRGEIIQTSFDDRILVGLRTFYDDPMGGGEAIMTIGGKDHGLLTSLHEIGNPPAVVISKLVRFVATGIKPFNPLARRPEIGNLLQLADGAILVRTQITLPQGTPQAAYVCLRSGNETTQRGTFLQSISSASLRGVSQSFELELIPEPAIIARE
jgi:hypothetical protein